MQNDDFSTWKTKTLVVGGVAGAVVGLGTALMMIRSAEKKGGNPPDIRPTDLMGSVMAVIGVVRGIAALGD